MISTTAKSCNRCNIVQSVQDFHRHAGSSDGYRTICKTCTKQVRSNYYRNNKQKELDNIKLYLSNPQNKQKRAITSKKWKKDNPDRVLQHKLTRYNLNIEQYNKLVIAQDGKCAICKEHTNNLVIDHNHSNSQVRELLCNT